jgi:predicted DNA-binding transcriptional regulator AlpA
MTLSPQREATDVSCTTQLLNCKEVCLAFGGIDPATLYRGIRAGRYPAPIHVGPNTSRWLRVEVEAALQAMIVRRAEQ